MSIIYVEIQQHYQDHIKYSILSNLSDEILKINFISYDLAIQSKL